MSMMADNERLFFTVQELAKVLPLSRNSIYQACSTGEIRCLRIGKRLLISKLEIQRLLGGNSEDSRGVV